MISMFLTGDIVHNTPKIQEQDKKNRVKIYQRSGFGPVDPEGDQFCKVNRLNNEPGEEIE